MEPVTATETNPNPTDTFSGGFELSDLLLITTKGHMIDLRRTYLQLDVFESIYSNTMTGSLLVTDAVGMFDNIPFAGEEYLKVKFKSKGYQTDDKQMNKTFVVFKCENVTQPKERYKTYRLHFVSREMFLDQYIKISKAYQGRKASAIVRELVTTAFPNGLNFKPSDFIPPKELNIEDTFYNEYFIAPYWSPLEIINWLASRSQSASNKNSVSFYFFENKTGYNFKSLEKMAKGEPVGQYSYLTENITETQYYLGRVSEIEFPSISDTLKKIPQGMFASTLVVHDILKKSRKEIKYDYDAYFDKTQKVDSEGSGKLRWEDSKAPKQYDSLRVVVPVHSKIYKDMPTGYTRFDQFYLPRISLYQTLHTFPINVRVPGNSRLYAGAVVDFKYLMDAPVQEAGDDSQAIPHKYHSGRYLITDIHHIIVPHEYKIIMKWARDSVKEQIG